jgi:uncharacterized coiled-coil protein SlyX
MKRLKSFSTSPIDLNAATGGDLVAAGFSSKQAEAVLSYAAEHGPWTTLEQLLVIDGLDGDALEALRPRLYVVPRSVDARTGPSEAPPDAEAETPEGAIDATDETEGRLEIGVAEDLGAHGSESALLEPVALYPVACAMADKEHYPEPVPVEAPVSDMAGKDLELKPVDTVEPIEAVKAVVGSALSADMSARGPDDNAEAAAAMGILEAAPMDAPRDGVAVVSQGEITPGIYEMADLACPEARTEPAGAQADVAGKDIVPGHIADSTGAYESVRQAFSDDTAGVYQVPTLSEVPLASAIPEAPILDVESGRIQASEVDGSEPWSRYAAVLNSVEPKDEVNMTQSCEAASTGADREAVGSPGVGAVEAEPAGMPHIAAMVTPVAPEPAPQGKLAGRSRWHDLALVAVGGLLGVLVTLVILGVLGGTLSYAPRSLVDALSANMSTMQQNQETSWSRTQALGSQMAAMEARLGAVEALDDRVAELEGGKAATEATLSELVAGLGDLDANLAKVAQRHATLIDDLSGRVTAQEDGLTAMGESVIELRGTVDEMEVQVARYEAFFDALRELLLEMQGEGAGTDTGM